MWLLNQYGWLNHHLFISWDFIFFLTFCIFLGSIVLYIMLLMLLAKTHATFSHKLMGHELAYISRHKFAPVDLVLHFFRLKIPMNWQFFLREKCRTEALVEEPFHSVFTRDSPWKPGGGEGRVSGELILKRSCTGNLWAMSMQIGTCQEQRKTVCL